MQIQTSKEGGVIVYGADDFMGFAPGYDSTLYPTLGRGASWLSGINPFLKGPGTLCPGLLGTALTNAAAQVSAVINSACVERTSTVPRAWLIEAGTKIHQIALNSSYTISTESPFPYTIVAEGTHSAHTTQVGEDIVAWNLAGIEYVFFSYNDNTDGDVGQASIDGSSINDDWFSTLSGGAVLNKNVPHPMIVGDNQKLYIADLVAATSLAKLWEVEPAAGAVASFTAIIPRNYVIRAFTKTGDYLVILANKIKGSSGVPSDYGDAIAFFWDYSSATQAQYKYSLNDNEVTAGFNYGGTIGCFTQGRATEFANIGYRSKLQIFEGGKFVPKFNFSQNAPKYGGLDIVNNMVIWNSGGKIYSYGSPYPDLPVRVNCIDIAASTSNGFLKSLNGIEIYCSSGSGASNEVFKQATTYITDASWKGLNAQPIFPMDKKGRVTQVEICYDDSTASDGRSMTLDLDTDYGTSTTIFNAEVAVTAGKNIVRRSSSSSSGPLPSFNVLKPSVTYATGAGQGLPPVIRYIKIYFKYIELK